MIFLKLISDYHIDISLPLYLQGEESGIIFCHPEGLFGNNSITSDEALMKRVSLCTIDEAQTVSKWYV